ncbi:TIM-barrel domain-containing protein [Aquirufa sp. OSTEICH-129A]
MKFVKLVSISIAVLFASSLFAQKANVWKEVQPGVWKTHIGNPRHISLLQAAGAHALHEALKILPSSHFPLTKSDIRIERLNNKIYLRFPLSQEEQVFGLGLNFQTVNQRGRILNLHVDHYGGKDNGRTHAPVPFYVSSKGYGVLIDAAAYMTVYAGSNVRVDAKNPPAIQDRNSDKNWDSQPPSDVLEVLIPADGASIYVFAGPTPMQAVQRYNLFNGGGYLPPKWGLGFTQRVPTLFSQDDIIKEAKSFETNQFPLDFIGVEPGWHSSSYPCTFEWDPGRFPRPKAFLDTLAGMGLSANLWMNPYVSPKSSLYAGIKKYTGSHLVWNGIIPDFTMAQARKLVKDHFVKNHLDLGVGGYKIDEVDGYDNWIWPDVSTFPSGTSAEQMRQIYGLMVQDMTNSWFKEKNKRTYGLIRASNAGASRLPYVIYNDYYSHKDFITALVNSSFIGVLWTPEVRASKSAEEWVRRMQSVCFSPMAMLNAWSDGTKPWSFPEVSQAVNDVANLRMQLLPYLYTTFAQYRFEGKPPFRAMNLVDGFGFKPIGTRGKVDATENPYGMSIKNDIKDQYMMGDFILVAPMFAGEKSRDVYLPEGKWYDFYTGKLVGENQKIRITPSLEKIPLFVKDGAMIPMVPVHRQAPKDGQSFVLEIRHYGQKASTWKIYDDDGRTFNFEKGSYTWTELGVKKGTNGQLEPWPKRVDPKPNFGYLPDITWTFMTK